MAYATVDEIREEFKDIDIDTTTPIKTSQVEQFILEEDAFINAYISSRYVVPVVDAATPSAFLVLKKISRMRVGMRIKMILRVKTGNAEIDQEIKAIAKDSITWLDKIKDGTMLLEDVALSDDSSLRSFNAEEGITPYFDTQKQQW